MQRVRFLGRSVTAHSGDWVKVAQRSPPGWSESHHARNPCPSATCEVFGLSIDCCKLSKSDCRQCVDEARSRMYIIEQGNILMTPPKRLACFDLFQKARKSGCTSHESIRAISFLRGSVGHCQRSLQRSDD